MACYLGKYKSYTRKSIYFWTLQNVRLVLCLKWKLYDIEMLTLQGILGVLRSLPKSCWAIRSIWSGLSWRQLLYIRPSMSTYSNAVPGGQYTHDNMGQLGCKLPPKISSDKTDVCRKVTQIKGPTSSELKNNITYLMQIYLTTSVENLE